MSNFSIGYQDISVELIDYNKDIARHAWNCYRMTWNDLQSVEYDPKNEDVKDPACRHAAVRAHVHVDNAHRSSGLH